MSNQLQLTGGAKVRDLQDVIIGTSGVLSSLAFDVANGVPKLDSNGKILVSQLPNSVMEYKGTWDASTNTPTLANGTGNQGDVYLCNVAGTVNFGAGPITFAVGDSAVYSGSIWQRSGGATGTVTSVAVTESGDSLNITGSPITTSGTINIGFNGTNLQYVNGAGNLTTFPTLITSIGLSMPSAFSVANSPLTANGTIAVTGAGYASQYIRGDGTLADFPSSGGGGSSVSYYLNGGTSQGTIGGVTYYEMSKTADTGTGVDFTKSGDGFIVAFLTDANDPAQLNIPAGNWNYEIYASMSANGGTPQMYAELYKYDGTTFTLISTSTNEILYDGTNLNLYTFGMTVPATTLALTDRLAIKLYATNSGGKTTTVHTQDSHLCQVITTFSTGVTALNGLTAQVQYFQTGTSGTDFNISSTTATHTFNIPDASATARGLITTGTQTIAGTKTFSDATKNNGGIFLQNASSSSLAGYMNLGGLTNGVKFTSGGGVSNSFTLPSATGYTFTFPNATGTIALTSDIPTNPVGGTGTTNTLPKFTAASTIGNSNITDTGSLITLGSNSYVNGSLGIGVTVPLAPLQLGNGYTESAYDGFRTTGSPSLLMAYGQTSVIHRILGGVYSQAATVNLDLSLAISKNKGTGSGFRITSGVGTGVGTSNNYLSFSSLIGASDETFTATEYMRLDANGALGIGTTSLTGYNLRISKNITGAISSYGIRQDGIVQSDVTSIAYLFSTNISTQATSFNLTNIVHYNASLSSIGAGSSVTNQFGFLAENNLVGATNNYGFYGNIPSGTNRWNLYMGGTAANYMAGVLGIGTTSLTGQHNLRVSRNISGSTIAYGILNEGITQSDVTNFSIMYTSTAQTAAAAFTLNNMVHYYAQQATLGAGSSITNQYGFFAELNLTGATNNYGFFGVIPSGTNRWNLYMGGTANNYMAGSLGIGATALTGINLYVGKNITGATTSYGVVQNGTVQSGVTSTVYSFVSSTNTAASAFTLSNYYHFYAAQNTIGSTSAVTNQYGFVVENTLTGATNNYGFYGNIASGTNRWNLYMNGTASNYMAGVLNIGTTTLSGYTLDVNGTARVSGNLTIGQTSYLAGTYTLDAITGGIAGIADVARFSTNGNGGAGRGVGIVLGASGSTSTVSVARLVGYQETASATANNASFAIQVANSSGTLTEYLRINNAGNVGIGTSTPSEKLDVIGGALAAGNGTIRTGITYSTLGLIGTFTNHDLGIITNGTTKLTIASTGAATFSGKTNVVKDISDYAFTVTNTNTSGYGMYLQAGGTNNAIDVYNASGATQIFKVSGTGAATFSSTVTAKGTGNYNGFIADNSSSATIGGGYFSAYSFGVQRGIFGVAGAISGAADNNMCIFAEGGLGIKFFVNGSGTASHIMTSSGNVLIGTTDDGGKVVSYTTNAAQQFKAAGTAPAITFSNTVLSPTIGGVLGVCTAASQFFTGTASSDMVLANQFSAGDLIFGTNNLARMRVKASGVINITSIPTSSAGLVSGDIYSSAGVLMIV